MVCFCDYRRWGLWWALFHSKGTFNTEKFGGFSKIQDFASFSVCLSFPCRGRVLPKARVPPHPVSAMCLCLAASSDPEWHHVGIVLCLLWVTWQFILQRPLL